MSENPLISVIVPVYNVEKFLRHCIDSILIQTYKNLEIILVNDGSTDNSGRICDEYKEKDTRINVIHKKNGGLSDARNKGIEIATGDYISFIDSDDYIDATMLEKMLHSIENNHTDVAVCNLLYVDEQGEAIDGMNEDTPIKDEVLCSPDFHSKFLEKKYWYFVIAVNKLYKKEIWKDIRFPLGKLHEDEFTVHKIMALCNSISFISEKLYCYVQRQGSIIKSTYSVRRLDAVEAMIDRIKCFLDLELTRETEATFFRVIYLLREGYHRLNMNLPENRKRFCELRREFSVLCFKALFGKYSKITKLHLLVFSFSINSYDKIIETHQKLKSAKGERC